MDEKKQNEYENELTTRASEIDFIPNCSGTHMDTFKWLLLKYSTVPSQTLPLRL